MVRLSHRMVRSTWAAVVLISLFSVACSAGSPVLAPTYTPYPTYTPAPAQIIEVTPTPGPWVCLKGKLQVSDKMGDLWLIGEQLFCAPEWKISHMYGPDFNSIGDKPIRFSDFIPQE